MTENVSFQRCDKGLSEWYKECGRDNYFRNDGVGLFLYWVTEYGYDESDIKEELDSNDDDPTYLELDDGDIMNFPFISGSEPKDEQARIRRITKIVKYCWDHGKAPINDKNVQEINFKHKLNDESQKEHKEQVPKIAATLMGGAKSFFYCLGLEKVNNKFPVFNYLVDAKQRDKLQILLNGQTMDPSTFEWINNNDNLNKQFESNSKAKEQLASGIHEFDSRVCGGLNFAQSKRIDDSIEDIANYLVSISQFIGSLMNKHGAVPPFHIDCSIAIKNLVEKINYDDDDDDDDEDGNDGKPNNILSADDTDDDDDDDDDEKKEFADDLIDDLDIVQRLKANKCAFTKESIKKTNLSDYGALSRKLVGYFAEFKDTLSKKDKSKGKASKHHIPYINEYPHNKRFNIFLDRRNTKTKGDEITFFEPTEHYDSLPKGVIPLWHFEAPLQCLIPPKNKLKNGDQSDIHIKASAKKLMTFSFHVESSDDIKCYLFWLQGKMRFYPQDIVQVFKFMFSKERYDAFIKDEKKVINTMQQIQIKDVAFESFYNSLASGRKHKLPATPDDIMENIETYKEKNKL